jgi:hypothetical protein
MCLFFSLLLLGPRAVIIFWWLLDTARWNLAFDTWIWPLLGFLLLPWTTVMYVLVAPGGGIEGFDWVWMGLAVFADLASYGGGVMGRRRQTAY